ncbi:hypothetical protein YQE_02532, partial [Dendroctonus ponderosae]
MIMSEVCSSALIDVIHAVINGTDGCLFCFGHAGLGKGGNSARNTPFLCKLGAKRCKAHLEQKCRSALLGIIYKMGLLSCRISAISRSGMTCAAY